MLPSIRGSYLVFRIGLNHPLPPAPLFGWLADWLAGGWLSGWLAGCPAGWLPGWLPACLAGWPAACLPPLEITLSRPAQLCVNMRSKSMSSAPLCGEMANFYRFPRPVRQKMSLARATAQNPCIFYVQSACRGRHSAAVCSISISRSAQRVKNWPPLVNPCIFMGQSACRRRHSAAVCSISVSRSALGDKNWPDGA